MEANESEGNMLFTRIKLLLFLQDGSIQKKIASVLERYFDAPEVHIISSTKEVAGLIEQNRQTVLLCQGNILNENGPAEIGQLISSQPNLKSIAIVNGNDYSNLNLIPSCFHGLCRDEISDLELVKGVKHVLKGEIYIDSEIRQTIIQAYLLQRQIS